MTTLVRPGDFKFVTGRPQVVESGIHVRLAGLRVLDENSAGSHDSEGEGEDEMSKVEFHNFKFETIKCECKHQGFIFLLHFCGGMRVSMIKIFAEYFATFYPLSLMLFFLGALYAVKVPNKGAFWGRAMVALVVATFLAHVNRIFHLWPAHLLFPSGHTTLCLGLSVSLAMLRRWTLGVTMPLLLVLAVSLVGLKYHTTFDVLGAFPLVLVVYGVIHRVWRLRPAAGGVLI